jgi:aspartyl-tRNA(Asn)/glutamyl-tRNA(Gln) amidotransferase subunit A
MSDLCSLTLEQVALALRTEEVSPSEVLEAVIERTAHVGSELGCFVNVLEKEARRAVAELTRSKRDEQSPLWGVPISVKDNIDVRGAPTTAGSTIRRRWTAPSDAAAVAQLRSAGAIVFAKASLYEFAFGAPNPAFALARNPWSPDRSTGGSSSGSVSAVAARVGYASIGTDTGGSIRVPAGFCGVTGLKPTFGQVSTDGVVPVAWTLDHVGPIARTVRDCALMYNAMVKSPSARVALPGVEGGAAGLRIAAALLDDDLDPSVRAAIETALETLAGDGADVTYVQLPDMRAARWCLWVISSAEAADYHRTTLLERGGDYHPLVRRRLLRGRMLPAADYVRAQRLRRRLTEELAATAAGFDALVLPLSPVAAYDLHDRVVRLPSGVEDASSAVTRFTPLFSLTGWPALAVRCGLTPDRLPIGMQVVAAPGREEMTLRVARAFERATPWHTELPPEPRKLPTETIS